MKKTILASAILLASSTAALADPIQFNCKFETDGIQSGSGYFRFDDEATVRFTYEDGTSNVRSKVLTSYSFDLTLKQGLSGTGDSEINVVVDKDTTTQPNSYYYGLEPSYEYANSELHEPNEDINDWPFITSGLFRMLFNPGSSTESMSYGEFNALTSSNNTTYTRKGTFTCEAGEVTGQDNPPQQDAGQNNGGGVNNGQDDTGSSTDTGGSSSSGGGSLSFIGLALLVFVRRFRRLNLESPIGAQQTPRL